MKRNVVKKDTIIKAHCNQCGRSTNHLLIAEDKQEEAVVFEWDHPQGVETDEVIFWTTNRLLRCAGCSDVCLQVQTANSETTDLQGRPVTKFEHYPPRIFRPKPNWMLEKEILQKCPGDVRELLDEIYICMQSDCPRASAMAVRALLENIFVNTTGDKGTFKANVDAFQKAGHLSQTQRELLDTVLDAGHATIHRSFKPTSEELATVIDVAENLVQLLYVQKVKGEELKKRIPPRPKPTQ